ncbi:MAG: TIGR01906 family membrane protein [Clostridia bacterium]|nr:TIGR01906 family membrane protein [Clostridia bacterium]
MKRILYFFLGLIAFLSLLCSIAASCVTNENLMKQGFLQYSQTAHLNVSPTRYEDYAKAICNYLDGKTPVTQLANPDTNETEPAFSDKENLHMADVKGIVSLLKIVRWAGGGIVIGALLILYLKSRENRAQFLADAVGGFALSALFLLLIATVLTIWGAVNFDGLFVTFHKLSFSNDLWILNPNTDLLVALMPLSFFIWYAGEMLKSMLPVLGMMLLVIIGWLKTRKTQKETETK